MVLPVSAAAVNLTVEKKADVLKELTILTGAGDGSYNLDKQLERSEAAAFIVRIMGKERHVNANKDMYKITSFPDVPATKWFAPYIGYCYENGIINGYENGNFGPGDYIDEKSFLKLMLGVLGYENNVDYTWADVYDKAYEIGLIDAEVYERKHNTTRKYLRGDVVEVLYNSFKLPRKNDSVTVIQNLVNESIVTLSKAEELGLIESSVATEIQAINVLNANWITVTFNQGVYNVDNEDLKIYETEDFTKSLAAEVMSQTSNELVIKTDNQTPDKSYTLEIYNVTNTRGKVTDVLSITFSGYKDPNLKTDFFRISSVEPINRSMVNVYFTHPVNANSEIITNYSIYEGDELFAGGSYRDITVSTMNSVDNGVTIYLKTKTFTKDVEYKIDIDGKLTSAYGVQLNEGEGEAITFKGIDNANEEFKVVSVDALTANKVAVEFNREVDPAFAQKFINYTVKGPNGQEIPVIKAVVGGERDKKGKVVYLNLASSLDGKYQYILRFEYIFDIYKQSTLEGVEYKFDGAYATGATLRINQVVAEDSGTVCVRFNKSVDESTVLNKSNYSIKGVSDTSYYAIPEKVYYEEADGQYTVKLYLPEDKQMISGKKYKLTVLKALKDKLGDSPAKNLEYTFTGSGNTAMPSISKAVIISNDSIKVEFAKEISGEIPNLLVSNYILQYADGGTTMSKLPLSMVYANPKTIVLKFDELDYNTEYTLKFNELKDYSGIYTRTAADGGNSIKVTLGN